MRKFYYKLYGLNIESEVECNELVKSEKTCDDVKIIFGKLPEDVHDLIKQGCKGYCKDNILWFHIENVANYYLYNGNKMIIEPYEPKDLYKIKAYLLGTALGMILFQKRRIAIHGGTVIVNGKAVTIVGDTGAGKSTLTSALRLKGYSFMADDVSALTGNEVDFSYPQQKLCKDAMNKLGYKIDDYTMINDDREKYAIPIKDKFAMKPVVLAALFYLSISDNNDISIEEIKGSEKLEIFIENIYRIDMIEAAGLDPKYLKSCIDVVNKIHLYKIKRPKYKFCIDEQIKLIEDAIDKI